MTVTTFTDARTFLDAATALLEVDPISTNVIGSVTERLGSDDPVADNLWATVANRDDLVGAAMLNIPWNHFLSRMPTEAAIAIADRLRADSIVLPGVTGERGAAGVARIGPVYTPPDLRGHGYAAGATAAAAAGALAAGAAQVMLYTDPSNPTSNALYARLGFAPDHDAVQIRFDPAA
ncbi:MAG TPA: GNAT family N-acetyltransferase [Acidimicrobiales bacterium]|nr:GNAT family N-acetyltransferase [Acidimicrobiales bacterium]